MDNKYSSVHKLNSPESPLYNAEAWIEQSDDAAAHNNSYVAAPRLCNRPHIPGLVHAGYDDPESAEKRKYGSHAEGQSARLIPSGEVIQSKVVLTEYEVLHKDHDAVNDAPVSNET